MAGGTGRGLVFVGERKAGLVMIEVRLLPGFRVMTRGALRPERTTMRVILAVAIDAGGRSPAVGNIRAVTTSTRQCQVGIAQDEVGQIVCETRLVQSGDVGVTPVVFDVATPTLTGTCREHATVIAGLAANILRDVLVTVQAERGLPLTVGAIVAGSTILFDAGVGLGERSGHDQCLEGGGAGPLDCQQRD